eukprot:m.312566 g.312566  ORF g.312566 m.312566 type:complete len:124 (-) comp30725_c0_seq1:48-419(-)
MHGNAELGSFDVGVSLSSFDHDGLGRYGDPLSANADMAAMALARCLLRPGGLLVLSVPVGPDVVVYNLHRRYGRQRLPALLHGWQVLAVHGWDEHALDQDANWRQTYEPVFVLEPEDVPHDEL